MASVDLRQASSSSLAEGSRDLLSRSPTGELILNIIALAIAGVMLFNFLYSRGLWQKYALPPPSP